MTQRPRHSLSPYLPLAVILVVYVTLGALYAVFTPAWQAPDEPAHFNYVRQVALTGTLPILRAGDYDEAYLNEIKARRFPPELSIDNLRYEGHQPPLYYLLATPVLLATASQTVARQVLGLRLFGVLLGAGVVVLTWASALRLSPDRPGRAVVAAGFVGLLPMHVAMMASVNNDSLAELLIAAGVYRLLGHLARPQSTARAWAVTGLVAGLGLLAKLQAYILLPMAVIVWLGQLRQTRDQPGARRAARRRGLALIAPALALPLLWWLRNGVVYGPTDPFGLGRHDAIVTGQPRTFDWIIAHGWAGYLDRLVTFTFHSFWGIFGWLGVFMDARIYALLALLSLFVVTGLIWQWRQGLGAKGSLQRRGLALLGLQVALVIAAYIWYNLGFVQHQGRYLFPALLPLGIAFAIGLDGLHTPGGSRWGALAGLGATTIILLQGLRVGDINGPVVLLAAAATIGLGLHSRWPVIRFRWWGAATLALLALIALQALFAAVIPQLG